MSSLRTATTPYLLKRAGPVDCPAWTTDADSTVSIPDVYPTGAPPSPKDPGVGTVPITCFRPKLFTRARLMTDTATVSGNYTATKSAKQSFLEKYERNHANTVPVLKAFPGDKSEFRPHERSSTARKGGWTFVIEESLMLKAIRGEEIRGGGFPQAPDTWDQVLAAFDQVSSDLTAELLDPKNGELSGT